MANKYLDEAGLSYFWTKIKDYFQEKLVSGTNIKTINSESLLGSGNIVIQGGSGVDYVSETGTLDGWSYRKWASGRMEAEKDITTGSSWSSVGSAGINHNQTVISPPTGMTVTAGFANPKTTSQYLVNGQVQIGTNVVLEAHRLASSSASFTYHVTLIGTY